jgi:hypothetical protein
MYFQYTVFLQVLLNFKKYYSKKFSNSYLNLSTTYAVMSKLYGVEGTLNAVNCTFYLLGSKYNFKNCKFYLLFCTEPMDYGSTSGSEVV